MICHNFSSELQISKWLIESLIDLKAGGPDQYGSHLTFGIIICDVQADY